MEWFSGGGRIEACLKHAGDEECHPCSMISERCACGCDSSGHIVSARREDRGHARDTSAQGQAGRRGIVRSTHGLQGLVFFSGGGRGRLAQGRGPDGGFCCRWPICARSTVAVPYHLKSSAHAPSGPRSRRPSRWCVVSDLWCPCSDASASTAAHRPPSQRAARRQSRRPAAGMGARLNTMGFSGQASRLPAAQPSAPPHGRVGTAWRAGAGLDWPGHGARGGVALLRAGRRSARFFRAHPQCSVELAVRAGRRTWLESHRCLSRSLAFLVSSVLSAVSILG